MSALPRRDEVPPSDARVAAERPGVAQREDGWKTQHAAELQSEKTQKIVHTDTHTMCHLTPSSDTAWLLSDPVLFKSSQREALSPSHAEL